MVWNWEGVIRNNNFDGIVLIQKISYNKATVLGLIGLKNLSKELNNSFLNKKVNSNYEKNFWDDTPP